MSPFISPYRRRRTQLGQPAQPSGLPHKTINIDPTKVGTIDHTNFWFPFTGTFPHLADIAHGGLLTSLNNVIFAADTLGTTIYKFERVKHDLTTGVVDYRVKVPNVSHTAAIPFYEIHDSSIVDRSDAPNVWGATTRMMLHCEGPLANSNQVIDSSSSNNFATVANNPTFTTGQLGSGMQFDRTSNRYLQVALSASLQPTNLFTISAWVKSTGNFGDNAGIYDYGTNSGMAYRLGLNVTSGTPFLQSFQGGSGHLTVGVTAVRTNLWDKIVGVYDGSFLRLYLNGLATGTPVAMSGNVFTSVDNLKIGALQPGPFAYMDGPMDEFCIEIGIARSADWILATYNAENNPSTFATIT